jgi:hypothetical protein
MINDQLPTQHINCPHCKAQLNPAEVKEQECFTCGWPEPYDRENDDDTED